MAGAPQGVARRRHDPGKAGPQLRHRHPRSGGRDVRRRRRHDPPARVRPGADPGQRRPGGGQGDLPDVGRPPPGCHPHPRDAHGDLRGADATRHDRPRRGDGSHPARRASRRADADGRRRARLLPVREPGGPDRGRRRRRPGVAGAEEPRAGCRHGGRRGRRARAGIAGAGAPGRHDHLPDAARPPDRDTRTAVRDDAAGRGSRLDAGGPPARRARRGRPPHAQLRNRRQDPPDGVQGGGVRGPAGGHGDDLPERRAHFDQRALGRRDARHRHAGVGRGGRCGPHAGRDLEGQGLRRAGLVPGGLHPDPRLLGRHGRHALRRRARAAVHRQLVEQPAGVPGHRRGRRGAGVPGVGAGRPPDLHAHPRHGPRRPAHRTGRLLPGGRRRERRRTGLPGAQLQHDDHRAPARPQGACARAPTNSSGRSRRARRS